MDEKTQMFLESSSSSNATPPLLLESLRMSMWIVSIWGFFYKRGKKILLKISPTAVSKFQQALDKS